MHRPQLTSVSLHYSPAVVATCALRMALATLRAGLTTELQLLGLRHITVALRLWVMYASETSSEFPEVLDEISDWVQHEVGLSSDLLQPV
jgi:hypothetical protein